MGREWLLSMLIVSLGGLALQSLSWLPAVMLGIVYGEHVMHSLLALTS